MTPEELQAQHNIVEEAEVDVQAVLAEFDRESNTRHFSGVPKKIVRYALAAFALFVFYMNLISTWPEQIRRSAFLGLMVLFAFIMYPARKNDAKKVNFLPWYDIVLGLAGSGAFFYFVVNYNTIIKMATRIGQTQIIIGIIGIVILVEACRRVVGVPILFVAGAFVVYAFATGYSLRRVIYSLFYTLDGVIGTPIGVCSTFIVLFIILGAFLEKTNIGVFFIDIANSVAGWASGGPAKVAVIASALEGMYSGSSVANTVGSGSVTIPIMRRTGYKPEFAAAVEAAASTGGQIMPPIMGAAAFLMAEMTELPYATIAMAAILPAALYFTGIFLMVHLEAKKLGLRGLPKDQIPSFFRLLFTKGYLFLPVIVLVVCMTRFTPSRSACLAILAAIVVSMFRKETRMTPSGFVDALENGAKNTLGVAIACSIAGIIVGVVTLTGIGLKLADTLLVLSGGHMLPALCLTMIACIILGMGVPTTANYVIMATITAPIILKINPNIPVLAAHMFVFYFGIVADITPPVALAAYAGSAIAGGNPFKTGVTATRLAIAAFVVPYMFVLSPAMLLIDTTPLEVVRIVCTSLIGMYSLSAGMEGFMKSHMPWWERLLALAGGLMLISPTMLTDVIGVLAVVVLALLQYVVAPKRTAAVTDGAALKP